MKIIKKIALAVLIVLIAMQFYRPKKNSTQGNHTITFITETNPSPEIKKLLESSCYNCHSNNTKYPWYNDIAPISYWLANHIKEGKGHLNFSEWEGYSSKKKDHKLEEVIEVMDEEVMPLREYTWTHKEAKLLNDQRSSIIEWAKRTRVLYQLNQQPQ
ncbi:MAG: heme-binding domain-containing protein [Maribacter sp.]|nr:heme-binding domain-containing protein [Maribacter sp.]